MNEIKQNQIQKQAFAQVWAQNLKIIDKMHACRYEKLVRFDIKREVHYEIRFKIWSEIGEVWSGTIRELGRLTNKTYDGI